MMYGYSCTTCMNMHTACQRGKGVATAGNARSVLREVALDLPLAHAADVLLPFLTLGFDEPLVDVWPQRITDHVVLLEHVQRVVEVARQLIDPVFAPLAKAHLEDVLIHGVGGGELALNAVQPGCQLYGQGQIRIR